MKLKSIAACVAFLIAPTLVKAQHQSIGEVKHQIATTSMAPKADFGLLVATTLPKTMMPLPLNAAALSAYKDNESKRPLRVVGGVVMGAGAVMGILGGIMRGSSDKSTASKGSTLFYAGGAVIAVGILCYIL